MALISVIKMYLFGTMLNRQFGKTHHVILGYQVSFRLLSKESTTIKSKGKASSLNNAINLFHSPHSPYHTQPNTLISPLHLSPPHSNPLLAASTFRAVSLKPPFTNLSLTASHPTFFPSGVPPPRLLLRHTASPSGCSSYFSSTSGNAQGQCVGLSTQESVPGQRYLLQVAISGEDSG